MAPFYVPVCDCQALCLYGLSLRSFDEPLEPISLRLATAARVLSSLPFRVVIGYNALRIPHCLSAADTFPTVPNHRRVKTRSGLFARWNPWFRGGSRWHRSTESRSPDASY